MQVIPLKRSDLRSKIESQKGKFFTVYFEKQDKSFRRMNGRTGVTKYSHGGRNPAEGKPHLVNMLDRKVESMSLSTDPIEMDPYRCHCGAAWEDGECRCVHCCICGHYMCESDQGDFGDNICDECYGGNRD